MTKCKLCGAPIRWKRIGASYIPLEKHIDVHHGLFCGVDPPYPGWPGYPPISGGAPKEEVIFPDAASPENLEPLPGFRCGDCGFFGQAREYDPHLEYPVTIARCRLAGHRIQADRTACQLYEGPGRCACGCGLPVPTSPTRPRLYATDACKMRAYRARKKEEQPRAPQV